ncbi:MAG: excinuclease ABC subunit UvrA [Sodaliphilus sp.]|nr:excinuclease ABC subunit UvrA [Bacteroidales bacterium]MDY2591273.1 excinuclease ABC subunit UvrA [Sodaliphilus sp.]MDD7500780.1 excinuclease ABC subunit UvrA [Bacteroidales bacterium]MDD7653886.1 excinuclease ABC subunit UvrA [Bacteroidales bacterium]MDY2671750.1 excinuclease ABC subunit UvrA [Sodaliphilus sp.]
MIFNGKETECVSVLGARVHNLKNIDVDIPHYKLTVITGLSGSGKSSLAFDTIFAEGQRRYLETFSAYARNMLGVLERPDVDKITGLSPVISIGQKTTNKNPRSTVGTSTEVYDYLRLLFARAADAVSYTSGERMVKYSVEKILSMILDKYDGKKIYILAPLVKNRKGHYKDLFEQYRKKGYINVRIDGELREITFGMKLDRYKNHTVELVIDRLKVARKDEKRLKETVELAFRQGKDQLLILDAATDEISYYSKTLMDPSTGLSYLDPAPHNFSFNSPQGACHKCKGLGYVNLVDREKIMPDMSLSIKEGGVLPLGKYKNSLVFWQIAAICEKYGCDINTPLSELPEEALDDIMNGTDERLNIKTETLSTNNYFLTYDGLVKYIELQQDESAGSKAQKWAGQFYSRCVCPECGGARLNKEALHFFINGKNIAQLASMDISELRDWLGDLHNHMEPKKWKIADEIVKEILSRLNFMLDVGLDYVSLNRSSASLSGGESQRIRLATQIGSQLVNVLYILDEPSIGLHQRDSERLIASLKKLRDEGNTVIVVEHDKDMMLNADYIVDIGPKAGRRGGNVVFAGTPKQMLKESTLTADYLSGLKKIEIPKVRRSGNGDVIRLRGCNGHNLKNVDVDFPLGTFICVTGVSGSGKSSLVNGTLQPIISQKLYRSLTEPLPYKSIEGLEHIDKVVTVDQSPLGRTPRSNPATYTGVFTDIRNLFVNLPESKIRGYKPGRFSFNAKGGRCEVCNGNGYKTVEMNFLPDVLVPCEVCGGKRYNRETLEVKFKGKSIADVLDMTINQAVEFFDAIPAILNKIKVLQEVGLGYIKLGQPSSTLSGGECQRVKLAAELSKKDTGKTLYILDEPTTGLHFEDIKILLSVLDKLVQKRNTVITTDHNLDVIKCADYIIDLGPEGGRNGGQIVAFGTPEEVAENPNSITARFLKKELSEK